MVERYRFGHVEVDGRAYDHDITVLGNTVNAWWRDKGHRVSKADLEEVLAARPETLIVGTGAFGMMRMPDETRAYVDGLGIELATAKTAKAVEHFNALQAAGRDAALAIHLTC